MVSVKNMLALIGLVGVALALSLSSLSREECVEGVPCEPVDNKINDVATLLYTKYGVSKSKAFEIAEKLFSGDPTIAEEASKEIARIGAVSDVLEVLGS